MGNADPKDAFVHIYVSNNLILLFSFQVYVVVGIAGVALTGCVLMVIILKYGRNSKFGIKGEFLEGVLQHFGKYTYLRSWPESDWKIDGTPICVRVKPATG